MNQEPVAYDRHHIFWEKRRYTTPIEKRVRNMGAFIIRMNLVDHRELHANTFPPPKLAQEEYHDLYNFMQEHSYELNGTEGLEWGLIWAQDRRIYELEENLEQQLFYGSGDYRRSTDGKTA